jgi:hypothetical protein
MVLCEKEREREQERAGGGERLQHFPVNGNDFLLTNILQRNKHTQMLKTFSGKYFTVKQTEPK